MEIVPVPHWLLPLRATDKVAGVLVALRHDHATPFSQDQEEMMAAFADQAALAWQLATSQRMARELDVLADRDRIARDLHDHVIQRLFAVGLALQGTIPRARSPEVQQRLSEYVDDLQAVIEEIRTTIFDLHGPATGMARLRQRLDEAIAQYSDGDITHHDAVHRTALGGRRRPGRSRRSRCARSGQQRRATRARDRRSLSPSRSTTSCPSKWWTTAAASPNAPNAAV